MAYGLLLLRVIAGLTIAAHGAQKLFGWFGGGGLKGTAESFDSLGFRPAALMALLAGLRSGS
jgi:putative oxidoreductase